MGGDPQQMIVGNKIASDSTPIKEGSWFDREVRWLRMDTLRAVWIAAAVLGVLIAYLGVIARLATGPINVFHNDALWMLDNGWRVLNGQVPHRDFYTPLGALEYWILAGGMLLARGSAQGLEMGFACFGLVIGIWSWLLSRWRLPALFALLVTAWIVFTVSSPSPLGFGPEFLSCAMIQNREAYGLAGIVLVECAFARERARFGGGLSSGIALILLAFLKLNFFGVAGLMLLASVPLRRDELPRLWGFLAGLFSATLVISILLRFSFAAFFADMIFVLHAHAPLTLAATMTGVVTCAKSGAVWLVAALMVTLLVLAAPARRWNRRSITLVALSCIVLASGPLFLQTNTLENRCTLASLWVIILVEQITAMHLQIREKQKPLTVVLIALGLGSIVTDLVPNIASVANVGIYQSPATKKEGLRIDAPGMENMRFYDSTAFYDSVKAGDGDGTYYVKVLNDGLALLRGQSRNDESILVLGFTNPFSYLLRRKPAEGGSSFLFIPTSITPDHMPAVDRIFGDADLMMLPQYEGTHQQSDQFIQNYYRNYLLENFHFVAKSQDWSLYRRNK
jgi:hypothetical protein